MASGMVERFNGRIEEVLQSHHFRSGEELETTLHRYVWLYNQQLPQSALASRSPLQAMKDWHKLKPKLFKKQPYYLTGCDTLRRIAGFYAVDADIRCVSPGQRLSARQGRTAPLVAAFGGWLQAQRRKISAKSRLGEKLGYRQRNWDGLQTFLHDGRVEIDSNRVENLIRPIALTRKNALFAGHDEGGIAWGRIASLIETCKINGIEPFAYLRAPPTAIANGHPQSRLDELLPWNFTPSS
jgi:hypothetical protein